MSSQLLRTESGYQCGNLHVTGLPRRLSHVLLLRALGNSISECAQVLGCSAANIKQATAELFFKLNADSSPELITRAFQNGHLRFLSFLVALFIGLFSTVTADHQNLIARISRTPRTQLRTRGTANARNNNGIYWLPETNELVWG